MVGLQVDKVFIDYFKHIIKHDENRTNQEMFEFQTLYYFVAQRCRILANVCRPQYSTLNHEDLKKQIFIKQLFKYEMRSRSRRTKSKDVWVFKPYNTFVVQRSQILWRANVCRPQLLDSYSFTFIKQLFKNEMRLRSRRTHCETLSVISNVTPVYSRLVFKWRREVWTSTKPASIVRRQQIRASAFKQMFKNAMINNIL